MIKQTWRCLAVAVLTLLLVSCNDVSSLSFEQSNPAPPPAADVTPDVAAAVSETVPIEATAVPPSLVAGPASASPLPAESSSRPELRLSQRWSHRSTAPVSMVDFVSLDGGLYSDIVAATEDSQVLTLSVNNRSYWEASFSEPILAFATGQVYGRANGDVALSLNENNIQLLELSDVKEEEEILWQYEAPSNVTALAFVNANRGTSGAGLLAGTTDGRLLALDEAVTPVWTSPVSLGHAAVTHMKMVSEPGESWAAAVSTAAGLLSLIGEQGDIRWQMDLPSPASHVLAADLNSTGQQEIIVGTTTGELMTFDQAGTELWRWQSANPIEALSVAGLDNVPNILVGNAGQLTALALDGSMQWQYQLGDSLIEVIDSGDVDGDGLGEIFVGNADGAIFVLDENGRIRGKTDVGIPVSGLQLVNMDGDSPQPELVVWVGATILLFDVVEEDASVSPVTPSPSESPLDEVAHGDLPHYEIDVLLDVETHRAQVQQKTTVRNTSDEQWDELVFHVSPAYWPGIFELNDASVQMEDVTTEVTPTLDNTMLHITMPRSIEPGQDVSVALDFALNLPKLNPTGWGPTGNTGWGQGVTQMGDWYPALVPYQSGSGWKTWEFKPVGDPVISRLADFDVEIRPSTPTVIAAPGFEQTMDDGGHRYRLEDARAFSFLAMPDYVRQDGNSNGVPITVYTTARYQDAGRVVLETAKDAIELFSELYGSYPYKELIIAENGYLTAMEYSGLISLSGFAFDSYDGTASSLLVAITAHEVAHQWWYGAVGNDQVHEPWLDEGLAMISELLFYERSYPALTNWWWQFRVDRWNPMGYVDDTIYDYPDSESFVHNVYGMAARFMVELRDVMGEDAFARFLQDYSTANRSSFVTRDDFFAAVQSQTNVEMTSLIDKYFRNKGS